MMIRLITSDDERKLRRLIMHYLKQTYDAGGDFPPTPENASAFTQHAIDGAAVGDPCLVAADDAGNLIGFCVARGVHFPGMQVRYRTIRSWGTYVVPNQRASGVGVSLFIVAGRVARVAGYERFLGMTHGSEYEDHAIGVVRRIPGMQEVGKVLMMDLTRKAVHTAPVATNPDPPPALRERITE